MSRQVNSRLLREMREDLGGLILRLLNKYRDGVPGGYKLSPKAQEALLSYSYPGNFRELENILERAVALASGNIIGVDDLQINLDPLNPATEFEGTNQHQVVNGLPNFQMGSTQIQDYLDDIERQILEYALRLTQGNRTQAAKALGISFRSMRYRLERLNIDVE